MQQKQNIPYYNDSYLYFPEGSINVDILFMSYHEYSYKNF